MCFSFLGLTIMRMPFKKGKFPFYNKAIVSFMNTKHKTVLKVYIFKPL